MTRRLLLLEDDPDHAYLIRRQLDRLPAPPEVDWVDSVEAARLALEASAFDLVVVDLRVRGEDGLQILVASAGARARAVVLSSSDHPGDRARSKRAGALDYLVKPAGSSGYAALAQTLAVHLSG